jgi:hypothetical protein
LAKGSWVGVDLPVVVERPTGEEDGHNHGDESRSYEAQGDVDSSLIELETRLDMTFSG